MAAALACLERLPEARSEAQAELAINPTSGVLFEVATNEPGFDRDEDTAHFGEALKLPKQHAHLRAKLEQSLEPIAD